LPNQSKNPFFRNLLEALRLATNVPIERSTIRARLKADFATASAADAGPERALELSSRLSALQTKSAADADPAVLIDDFIVLLGDVSDNSKITLDPILDGYYVGDTMVNKVPSLIDGLAQSGAINAHALLGLYLGTNDRIALTMLAGQIETARDGIDHNIGIARTAAPYLPASFDALRRREQQASSRAADWLSVSLLKSNMPHGDPADWATIQTDALSAGFSLYDASVAAMDEILRKRIDALVRREISIFALVFIAIVVAAVLMLLTTRSMSRHLADKIGLQHEIVERTEVEKQLAHAALHDKLTGLANRAFLMHILNTIVAKTSARPHSWAILFLDLDRFKVVNDSLGHIAGDVVLVEAARRFERCVRSCDTLARLGGDEFIILIDEIDDFEIAHDIARRALRAFDLPFEVSGRDVFASASIGIAISQNGDDRPEDVLRNADIAMYRAKALGKNRCEIFTADLLTSAISRLEVETDLARALERNEFRLFYQPIISLHDGRLRGFEALVRWQHPTRGLVGPDQFINIIEENGAIVAIGEWILREGCRQLNAWRTTLVNAQDLRMNINVSAKQLASRGFARTIESALSANGLDPDAVNMEITESVLMENPEQARAILIEIKRMGVHIHLDDFGTGYSSLAYLRDFPIDALKIDKSFVSSSSASNAEATLASVEIIRTIIALAQSLSLTITAEGVETDAQREELRTLGCDRGQGYFFSRPIDASRAGAFIVARMNQNQEGALDRSPVDKLPATV
jgi:diguanylate cyclase (GGDEF)-like protein